MDDSRQAQRVRRHLRKISFLSGLRDLASLRETNLQYSKDEGRFRAKTPSSAKAQNLRTMTRKLSLFSLSSIALIAATVAHAAGPKIEQIGAYADSAASDALKKSLDVKGWRVSLDDGAYCDLWFGSSVVTGKTDQSGAVYTSLGESALVGVITFAKATTDFRGQSVKPGSYTLRYALHPADGNHMGISRIRDFLVMLPVAMDPNPDAKFKFEELAKMSTKVTGTNHPGVLSLVQLDSAPAAPKVAADESNHIVISAAIKSQSGAVMPIAIVIKGHAEQ